MAVGTNAIELLITAKFPISGGRAIYVGNTVTAGAKYLTGGANLEESVNSRFKMPERWDYLSVEALGLVSRFVSPNKLKVFAETTVGASTETGLSEYKNEASMATAFKEVPFIGIGLA